MKLTRTFGTCSNILNSIKCQDEMMLGVVTVVRKYCGAMYCTAEMTANKIKIVQMLFTWLFH